MMTVLHDAAQIVEATTDADLQRIGHKILAKERISFDDRRGTVPERVPSPTSVPWPILCVKKSMAIKPISTAIFI